MDALVGFEEEQNSRPRSLSILYLDDSATRYAIDTHGVQFKCLELLSESIMLSKNFIRSRLLPGAKCCRNHKLQ